MPCTDVLLISLVRGIGEGWEEGGVSDPLVLLGAHLVVQNCGCGNLL